MQKRPLLLPHEIRELRSDEQIIFVRGRSALRCGRAIFFRRPEMLEGLGQSRVRMGVERQRGMLSASDGATAAAVVAAAGALVTHAGVAGVMECPEPNFAGFDVMVENEGLNASEQLRVDARAVGDTSAADATALSSPANGQGSDGDTGARGLEALPTVARDHEPAFERR